MKRVLFEEIDSYRTDMIAISDAIFDHPELAMQERYAADALTSYLAARGFPAERPLGGLETAFRITAENLEGGPSVGLLAEYDALPGVRHACGHHMQGPVMIAAFLALCQCLPRELPWKLVLYGTPGEEGGGGKVLMADAGCFRDIDFALMMHGGDTTTYDPTMSANADFQVRYTGKSPCGDPGPWAGNDAFEALRLAMTGVEFMREHLRGDARIHYAPLRTISAGDGSPPHTAAAAFMLRSLSDTYLDGMIQRFFGILQGAAQMTDTAFSVKRGLRLKACFPNEPLAELFYRNARSAGAQRIAPPRGTMGSTDFGNVMAQVPGICARVAFAPQGTGAHSLEWAQAGKSEAAHACILSGAKIIAGMAWELVTDGELRRQVRQNFMEEREKTNPA